MKTWLRSLSGSLVGRIDISLLAFSAWAALGIEDFRTSKLGMKLAEQRGSGTLVAIIGGMLIIYLAVMFLINFLPQMNTSIDNAIDPVTGTIDDPMQVSAFGILKWAVPLLMLFGLILYSVRKYLPGGRRGRG